MYQQVSCEVSRKSLDNSSIAVKSLERVSGQAGLLYSLWEESLYRQDKCEVSRKSLRAIMRTSRIAVKSPGRVWIPAG